MSTSLDICTFEVTYEIFGMLAQNFASFLKLLKHFVNFSKFFVIFASSSRFDIAIVLAFHLPILWILYWTSFSITQNRDIRITPPHPPKENYYNTQISNSNYIHTATLHIALRYSHFLSFSLASFPFFTIFTVYV